MTSQTNQFQNVVTLDRYSLQVERSLLCSPAQFQLMETLIKSYTVYRTSAAHQQLHNPQSCHPSSCELVSWLYNTTENSIVTLLFRRLICWSENHAPPPPIRPQGKVYFLRIFPFLCSSHLSSFSFAFTFLPFTFPPFNIFHAKCHWKILVGIFFPIYCSENLLVFRDGTDYMLIVNQYSEIDN